MEIVDTEESKTLEEWLVSKKWSVWASAFEELATKLKGNEVSKDQQDFFAGEVKKYIADNNPASMEKALLAIKEFVVWSDLNVIVDNYGSWINLLLTKGVTHNKQNIIDLSLDVIKDLVKKSQKFEDLTEPLLENMKSTNIKVKPN